MTRHPGFPPCWTGLTRPLILTLPIRRLVSQIAFTSSQFVAHDLLTKNYDFLNRLTSISDANPSAVVLDSHTYAYNSANQRTAVTNAWLVALVVIGYDSLGQVTSGVKYWSDTIPSLLVKQFGYDFDNIGNRITTTSAGGDQWGANLRYGNYTANNLNQIHQPDRARAQMGIISVATNTSTVTVNNQPTYRKGTYYRAQLPVTNSSGAVYQSGDKSRRPERRDSTRMF